jgi:hypothetical protein
MSKLSLRAAILLLSSAWVLAQSGAAPSNQNPGSTSPSAQQPAQQPDTSQKSTGEDTVEGCVARTADVFTLTDASGNIYKLAGDTRKLADHVGHQVRITGGESPGRPGGATSGATSGPAGGGRTLYVDTVKMIASSCPSK